MAVFENGNDFVEKVEVFAAGGTAFTCAAYGIKRYMTNRYAWYSLRLKDYRMMEAAAIEMETIDSQPESGEPEA